MRNWVDSAQDRDYWKVLVKAALNLRVPQTMELVRWIESSVDDDSNNSHEGANVCQIQNSPAPWAKDGSKS